MTFAVDAGIAATTAVALLVGWRLGLLRLFLPVAGLGLAFAVIARYAGALEEQATRLVSDTDTVMWLSMGLITMAAVVASGILIRPTRAVLYRIWLRPADSGLGSLTAAAAVGAAWATVIGVGLADGGALGTAVDASYLAGMAREHFPQVLPFMPEYTGPDLVETVVRSLGLIGRGTGGG